MATRQLPHQNTRLEVEFTLGGPLVVDGKWSVASPPLRVDIEARWARSYDKVVESARRNTRRITGRDKLD